MGRSTEYIFGVYHTVETPLEIWATALSGGLFGPSRTCFWKMAILSRLNKHYFEIYQNRWKISGNFLDKLGENLDFRFNCAYSKMHGFNFQVWIFEIFLGRNSPSPLPRLPPRAQSQASSSILGRFASSVRAAPSIHPSNMFDNPSPNRGVLDQPLFSPKQLSGYYQDNVVRLIVIYQWKYPWRQAGRIFWKSSVMNASYWNIQYSELFAPEASILVQNTPKSLAAGAPPQTPLGELTALPQTP